jgi:hypothetical protein
MKVSPVQSALVGVERVWRTSAEVSSGRRSCTPEACAVMSRYAPAGDR